MFSLQRGKKLFKQRTIKISYSNTYKKNSECVYVCELMPENGTTQSYQISYEDSKIHECVHLRFGFSNFLLVFIFFYFYFERFFLGFLYKLLFYFTINFEIMLQFLLIFLCLKGLLFTQGLLLISLPSENLKFVCLNIA